MVHKSIFSTLNPVSSIYISYTLCMSLCSSQSFLTMKTQTVLSGEELSQETEKVCIAPFRTQFLSCWRQSGYMQNNSKYFRHTAQLGYIISQYSLKRCLYNAASYRSCYAKATAKWQTCLDTFHFCPKGASWIFSCQLGDLLWPSTLVSITYSNSQQSCPPI